MIRSRTLQLACRHTVTKSTLELATASLQRAVHQQFSTALTTVVPSTDQQHMQRFPTATAAVNPATTCSLVQPAAKPWRRPHHQQFAPWRHVCASSGGQEGPPQWGRLAPPPHTQQQQQPHSTSSTAQPVAPTEPSVLSSRAWWQARVPLQRFKVVGVSFEGRQALIPHLKKGQAVAFAHEPNNPHDPNAVAVQTLDGQGIGYIARDKTFHFLNELSFGWVDSVGQQGEDGLWGLRVLVQPCIVPVEVYSYPESLRQHVNLGLHLAPTGGLAWASLKAAVLQQSKGRCAVTGAPLAAVHERWQFDDAASVMRLVGFRAEAPEVQQVGGLLEVDEGAASGPTALLQQLNCWQEGDTQLYLNHSREVRRQRSGRPWRLDLSLLAQRGIPVPPQLQALCV